MRKLSAVSSLPFWGKSAFTITGRRNHSDQTPISIVLHRLAEIVKRIETSSAQPLLEQSSSLSVSSTAAEELEETLRVVNPVLQLEGAHDGSSSSARDAFVEKTVSEKMRQILIRNISNYAAVVDGTRGEIAELIPADIAQMLSDATEATSTPEGSPNRQAQHHSLLLHHTGLVLSCHLRRLLFSPPSSTSLSSCTSSSQGNLSHLKATNGTLSLVTQLVKLSRHGAESNSRDSSSVGGDSEPNSSRLYYWNNPEVTTPALARYKMMLEDPALDLSGRLEWMKSMAAGRAKKNNDDQRSAGRSKRSGGVIGASLDLLETAVDEDLSFLSETNSLSSSSSGSGAEIQTQLTALKQWVCLH